MSPQVSRRLVVSIAVSALLALGACATDDPDDPDAAPAEEASPEATATPSEVEVTGQNYSYTGVPGTIETGTKISFTNASADEAHEIVAFPLPATETRPASEIFKLPEAELTTALGGPPAFVIIGAPGQDGRAVVGDGTLMEPGRYVFACFIPVGADPQEYLAAAEQSGDGPPVVEGGPPHFTEGMFAEATVG
ncbi:hypothetical protein BH23ACT12_BH23ACT12_22460 [soil metagenome]